MKVRNKNGIELDRLDEPQVKPNLGEGKAIPAEGLLKDGIKGYLSSLVFEDIPRMQNSRYF